MKFYQQHGAFICQSKTLVQIFGFLSLGKQGATQAKAAAFWPIVFIRDESIATPLFINHEKIHFQQQLETLFVGSLLLQFIEDFYLRLILKHKAPYYYFYRAAEQEAYRNQHDLEYLKKIKWFSILKYIKDKRKLTIIPGKEPAVKIGEHLPL